MHPILLDLTNLMQYQHMHDLQDNCLFELGCILMLQRDDFARGFVSKKLRPTYTSISC